MVVKDLLKIGIEILGDMEYGNPQLEVRLILGKLLGVDKSYLYAHDDLEIDEDLEKEFISLMEKRAEGYPISYLLREKEFMGLDFHVEEGVLIPRPDTEILVEYVIEYINRKYKDKDLRILELGIGSGAIGLSIAYYCKNVEVYATDISKKAIQVSNINKEKFRLENVRILEGDLFKPVEDMKEGFDIILSNPPYIESEVIGGLQREVKDFEPMLALDGGEDGLVFYKEISKKAKEFLRSGGLLIYEIGYNQAEAVGNILDGENYRDIEIIKDLQGLDRVVLGIRGL